MSLISNKLKSLRNEKELTFKVLADRASKFTKAPMSKATIWNIENGHRFPEAESVRGIMLGLGLKKNTPEWFETLEAYIQSIVLHVFPELKTPRLVLKNTAKEGGKEFMRTLKTVSEDDLLQIQLACQRPDVLRGLHLLNALYEERPKK